MFWAIHLVNPVILKNVIRMTQRYLSHHICRLLFVSLQHQLKYVQIKHNPT